MGRTYDSMDIHTKTIQTTCDSGILSAQIIYNNNGNCNVRIYAQRNFGELESLLFSSPFNFIFRVSWMWNLTLVGTGTTKAGARAPPTL